MAKKERELPKRKEKDIIKELNALAAEITSLLENKIEFFDGVESLHRDLSGSARRRLYGAGVNNFGFIETAFDIARDNPDFTPRDFDFENFRESLQDFEKMRQLVFTLRGFLEAAEGVALLESDALYHQALDVYGNLREMTRRKKPRAMELFAALRPFFNRPKRSGDKPTDKELERDFKKVLHGEVSGEVTVVNESPALKAGKRMVSDKVGKGKRIVKAAGEGREAT
jgi:hypothetical protein